MRRVEKRHGKRVVRKDFRRMVLGIAVLLMVGGLYGISSASEYEGKVVGETAQKTVNRVVKQAKKNGKKRDKSVKEEVTKDKVQKDAAMPTVPEFVDINTQKSCPGIKGLKKDRKHVNHFTHAAHIEMLRKEHKGFVCATCHNGAKDEDEILKTDKCTTMEKELDKAGGPAKLKDYFHSTCLKCHKELKKEKKVAGPVSCNGCHDRKAGDK